MPILGITASSILNALNASSFESIATVTVGSGGSSSITFSSIPSTYKHLQIRFVGSMSANGPDDCRIQLNDDTGNNYSRHYFYSSGASASASSGASVGFGILAVNTLPTASDIYGGVVADILDYTDTNKNTTVRAIGGFDANGSGYIGLSSVAWLNKNAVTSIKLYPGSSTFTQYTTFALYGIKG